MTMASAIWASFGVLDKCAFLWLVIAWAWIGWRTEHPPRGKPSVSILMKQLRRDWMEVFVTRDPRILDGNILSNLRESTAFFASASMIAIGGGIALLGHPDRIESLAHQFALAQNSALQWEVKLIVPLLLLVDAFLKFVWANRLFGYCAVIMGATPNDPCDPLAHRRAMQAADLNIRAARSFNAGLRNVYFALGALAWMAGAAALAIAVALVLFVTWRREFASGSRRTLLIETAGQSCVVPGGENGDQPDR